MKICILGGCANDQDSDLALKLPREWQIWLVNMIVPSGVSKAFRTVDKMFHLHKWSDLQRDIPEHLEMFLQWAEAHQEIEYVVLEKNRRLPNATIFPVAELAKMPRGAYHCGSFDWLVAYALHLGAEEIIIGGVKLFEQWGEPMSSGPCLEYWCGYAEGKGVQVSTTPSCDLFWNRRMVRDRKRYGLDSWDLVETR